MAYSALERGRWKGKGPTPYAKIYLGRNGVSEALTRKHLLPNNIWGYFCHLEQHVDDGLLQTWDKIRNSGKYDLETDKGWHDAVKKLSTTLNPEQAQRLILAAGGSKIPEPTKAKLYAIKEKLPRKVRKLINSIGETAAKAVVGAELAKLAVHAVEHLIKMVTGSLVLFNGEMYVKAGAKLPISYTEDDTTAVDKVVAEFVSGIISSLKPGEKTAKDLGKALSYVLESMTSKLKEDPAIKTVDAGSLPKELR